MKLNSAKKIKTKIELDRSPFGPELSISNNTEYRAHAGDLIELPCGISSVSTHARISWSKNGHEIENISEKIYNHSLILQLSNTSINDSGNYACRIDDESGGRMISSMSLKVDRMSLSILIAFLFPNQCICLVSVQCQISVEKSNFHAGSNVELFCSTNADRSSSSSNRWHWFHNSRRIFSNTNRYSITNLTRQHMGMYQCCYLTNSFDSNSCCAQTQVHVISKFPIQ